MIDTLSISKRLQQAGATPQLAEEEAILWSELISCEMATKQNLLDATIQSKKGIKEAEAKLRKEIKESELLIK